MEHPYFVNACLLKLCMGVSYKLFKELYKTNQVFKPGQKKTVKNLLPFKWDFHIFTPL
jgi:hypothetical protein